MLLPYEGIIIARFQLLQRQHMHRSRQTNLQAKGMNDRVTIRQMLGLFLVSLGNKMSDSSNTPRDISSQFAES